MGPRPRGGVADPVADAAGGSTVRVHVVPSSRSPGVEGANPWRGALVVRVKAAAKEGEANAELCARLAQALGVEPARVELLHGARSRDKTVRVHGVPAEELRRRLGGLR